MHALAFAQQPSTAIAQYSAPELIYYDLHERQPEETHSISLQRLHSARGSRTTTRHLLLVLESLTVLHNQGTFFGDFSSPAMSASFLA